MRTVFCGYLGEKLFLKENNELFIFLNTVNMVKSEIFARILFSRIALKDTFVTLKIATRT